MEGLLSTTPTVDAAGAAGAELVGALNLLDVPFIAGGLSAGQASMLAPHLLLAKLAASPEARLRLALIPLLLRHPEFAADMERRSKWKA